MHAIKHSRGSVAKLITEKMLLSDKFFFQSLKNDEGMYFGNNCNDET